MLDWGVPDELDADNGLETLRRRVPAARARRGPARDRLPTRSRSPATASAALMAALYAAGHDDAAVRNLVLMATPIDFDEMGAMVAALREGRLNAEDLIDDTGNVPADALYSGFYMQAPTTEIAQKATLLENLWNDEFVEGFQAMAQWSRDHVPFPGAAFREVVGAARARERPDDRRGSASATASSTSAACAANVLNAMAERDNVVPSARHRARSRDSSAIPRGARSCGCPAATSRSAPAGRPSSTRCRAWPSGSRRTATTPRHRRSADGDPTHRARRPRGARAASSTASRTPTARSSRRTSTTPTSSPPGRGRATRARSPSRTARWSATSPSCRCTAGRATSARCGSSSTRRGAAAASGGRSRATRSSRRSSSGWRSSWSRSSPTRRR